MGDTVVECSICSELFQPNPNDPLNSGSFSQSICSKCLQIIRSKNAKEMGMNLERGTPNGEAAPTGHHAQTNSFPNLPAPPPPYNTAAHPYSVKYRVNNNNSGSTCVDSIYPSAPSLEDGNNSALGSKYLNRYCQSGIVFALTLILIWLFAITFYLIISGSSSSSPDMSPSSSYSVCVNCTPQPVGIFTAPATLPTTTVPTSTLSPCVMLTVTNRGAYVLWAGYSDCFAGGKMMFTGAKSFGQSETHWVSRDREILIQVAAGIPSLNYYEVKPAVAGELNCYGTSTNWDCKFSALVPNVGSAPKNAIFNKILPRLCCLLIVVLLACNCFYN